MVMEGGVAGRFYHPKKLMELVDFERNLRGKLHVFFVLEIKIVSSLGGCDQGRFKQLRMSCFHPWNWVNQSEMGRKKQIKDQQLSCPKGATHGSRELLDNWEFHGWLILLHPRPSSDESHWHDWLNCLMVIRVVVLLYIISYIYIFIYTSYISYIYLLGTFGDIWGPLWPLSQWASHVRQVNGFGVANPGDAECRGAGATDDHSSVGSCLHCKSRWDGKGIQYMWVKQ